MIEPLASRPARKLPPPTGFTLTEVVIALGIFGFGITAVLGLLAIAAAGDRDSSADSRAVIVARGIIADLRSDASNLQLGEVPGSLASELIPVGGAPATPTLPVTSPLSYLGVYDADLRRLSTTTHPGLSASYAGGCQTEDAEFLVHLRLEEDTSLSPTQPVTRAVLSIESPAVSPVASRRRSNFAVLLP